jgi:hypothetical protein
LCILGAKPLFGENHDGGDAIFALACNYPKEYYQRFVGIICMLTLLLMPLAGLHFYEGLDFVTPSL